MSKTKFYKSYTFYDLDSPKELDALLILVFGLVGAYVSQLVLLIQLQDIQPPAIIVPNLLTISGELISKAFSGFSIIYLGYLLGMGTAGVYYRIKYGTETINLVKTVAKLYFMFFLGIASIIVLILLFTFIQALIFVALAIPFILFYLAIVVGVIVAPFALVALIPFEKIFTYNQSSSSPFPPMLSFNRTYLVLNVIPNEKPKFCPFKDVEKNGCSYLGYGAPKESLICDFESTFTRCYVYKKLAPEFSEVKK